ncbi:inner membrane zinc metalloprotease required for the extracytoplasmic stress response mediated by sigma(W) [Oenococcus oeni]|uniref:RIP metalloprotease RseP n=1 Tax=Oenococcus oeni TaxID=1247 RepID=UPI0010B9BB24|nr:RIP metalloprotease RseP [Oenococcus oeni]SYV99804.1 inner membrane zinc metalloprotease required for the extracytoplasmic stress response mediated by sigma(W) [Oenococcus oeni]
MNFASIIAFIIVFGVIVTIHEFGHFFVAKKFGVVVYEFSIGMGPKIFGTNKNGTNYVIRILPVGGYVLMAGADQDNEYLNELRPGKVVKIKFANQHTVNFIDISEDPITANEQLIRISAIDINDKLSINGVIDEETNRELQFELAPDTKVRAGEDRIIQIAPKDRQLPNISLWKQILVNFAGPFMNFVLAFVLFFALAFSLIKVPVSNSQINPIKNYPAMKQGLKKGDVITKVDSSKISNWTQLTTAIENVGDKTMKVSYRRGNKSRTVTVKPKKVVESGGTQYLIGVEQDTTTGFANRIKYGFSSFFGSTTSIWLALAHLIEHPSLNQLGGPVAIAKTTSAATADGFLSLVGLTAFLSLNIGIFNLIPIPVLDGGKILLNLIQAIRHKPLSEKVNQWVMIAGVVFMILLMIAVTINDLLR